MFLVSNFQSDFSKIDWIIRIRENGGQDLLKEGEYFAKDADEASGKSFCIEENERCPTFRGFDATERVGAGKCNREGSAEDGKRY